MSDYFLTPDILSFFAVTTSLAALAKVVLDYKRFKETNERVLDAEKKAFQKEPQELEGRIAELARSQEGLESRSQEIARIIEESRNAIMIGDLFNLYSKQIEKYQQQTRSRASWSFGFAIVSMFAGLGFVFWGGNYLLSGSGQEQHVVAGAAMSAVGGAISAYITKTFLDVHQLSLRQLNRYFRQPVLNGNILMAQRLSNELGEPEARRKAYELLISSVVNLIKEEGEYQELPVDRAGKKANPAPQADA